MKLRLRNLLNVLILLPLIGCAPEQPELPPKAPRPVTVMTLKRQAPATSNLVTGSVGSWKTEKLGFEVSGRVLWTLEPGDDVEGRVLDSQGNVVVEGTAIAVVDPVRYKLTVEAKKAELKVAKLKKEEAEIDLNTSLAADVEVANAKLELAKVEVNRNKRLVKGDAGSKADLDKAEAELKIAKANIAKLEATKKQLEARVNSAIASIKQAEQSLKDAERSVADTKLFSSYRGQVAEVHVVPGSVVSQGGGVVTVQMMNPIKVEIEVSAEDSRRIKRRSTLPVRVRMPDGKTELRQGYVYTIDPIADPSTRTFTLTLLLLNEKIGKKYPSNIDGQPVARTQDIWPMDLSFLPSAPKGTYFVEKKAIRKEATGDFVWRIRNVKKGSPAPKSLEVEKLRVTKGKLNIPFIANLTFQNVTVNAGQDFNPQTDLYVGRLIVDGITADEWTGNRVLVDSGAVWMLRPGDLVRVEMGSQAGTAGFFVPMEAIYEETGKTYIFIAERGESGTVAKRIPVKVSDDGKTANGTLRRIIPQSADVLRDGMQLIVGGAHYLRDGEAIRVTESQ